MTKHVGRPPRLDSRPVCPRTASCNLILESLEPRQLLATTLYVDFGFGFNPDGFNINDADSASVGGPEVFGSDYHLTTLSQDLHQFFQGDPDFDNDDVQQFVDLVFSELYYLFEPFDVSVQYAQASSIEDIAATLGLTPTNDAYIYVGGAIPDAVEVDFGSSVIDPGNLQDNLGFVFTADLDFEDIHRTRDQVAANIARQAAFTYGVLATEATESAAYGNVTSLPGTDAEGNRLTPEATVKRFGFMRYDLPLILENGVSPGLQNTFDAFANAVGRNPDLDAEVVTTTGTIDDIQIEMINDRLTSFTINGRTIAGLDLGKDLIIRVAGHSPESSDTLTLDGQGFDIESFGSNLAINGKVSYQNVSFLRTVPVVTYLITGDFADEVELDGSGGLNRLTTNGGDDRIVYNGGSTSISTGDGDDLFLMKDSGNRANFWAGPGNDTLSHELSNLDGPEDVFLWDVDDDGFTFGFKDDFEFQNPRMREFETVTGTDLFGVAIREGFWNCEVIDPDDCDFTTPPILFKQLDATVDGDVSTINAPLFDQTLTVNRAAHLWSNNIYVLATGREISLEAEYVQLASDMDWVNGNTEQIVHDITVETNHLLASKLTGAGGVIVHTPDPEALYGKYNGLTQATVTVDGPVWATITIHGSDQSDYFVFPTELDQGFAGPDVGGQIRMFANGGDDGFTIGSTSQENSGNLGYVFGNQKTTFELYGGIGDDFAYINDAASSGQFTYDLSESGLEDVTPESQSRSRTAPRFIFGETELVRLAANSDSNAFRVDPSDKTIFHIEGGDPGAGDGDALALIGELDADRTHIVQPGQGNGAWYFGNQPGDDRIVVFEGMEDVVQSNRLALGSQPGGSSLVRVFNSSTLEHLFDINPYPARFTGGVQVDTADLTGDGIQDIIVAPGAGRYAVARIYDGVDGTLLKSFRPFPADSPIFSENFTGGVDIAVANVTGDSTWEIIASTLYGTVDVRTFVQLAPLEYELVYAYNPFPAAPGVGVRIDAADLNLDGLDDIISVPGPGWSPEVVIHSQANLVLQQLHRFSGYVPGYLGGFTVAAGDVNGDLVPDVVLGGANTGSALDPFSGQYRVFDGATLPKDDTDAILTPLQTVQAFDQSATRSISTTALDTDLDGIIDQVFAARRDAGGSGEVRVFDGQIPGSLLNSVFNNDGLFDNGIELG
ncbi:MAG: hypothetical protein ACR2NP_22685 [Pirellulaceae bacterium]